MEPDGSITHAQVPAMCPYPESNRPSPNKEKKPNTNKQLPGRQCFYLSNYTLAEVDSLIQVINQLNTQILVL